MSMHEVKAESSRLAALASGLCHDASIALEVHQSQHWAWDPVRRTILVAAEDLATMGHSWCAGVLAHEVAHFYISRYHLFEVIRQGGPEFKMVLNAIEDPRAEGWIQRRYPGTAAWFLEHHSDGNPPPPHLPYFFLYCFECAAEPGRGWMAHPVAPSLPTRVAEALDRTRAARRKYTELTPPTGGDLVMDVAELRERYREDVWPRLRASFQRHLPVPREQEVRLHAWEALNLALDVIMPEASSLLSEDCERLAIKIGLDDELRRSAMEAVRRRDHRVAAAIALDGSACDQSGSPAAKDVQLARDLFDIVLGRHASREEHGAAAGGARESTGASVGMPSGPLLEISFGSFPAHKTAVGAPRPKKERFAGSQQSTAQRPYDQALSQLGLQIDEIVTRIEEVLRPRRRLRTRDGYPSGSRISLARLMQFEADPRHYTELWSRTTLPERRDAAVLLLVDLSGSMSGEKAQAALLGTILLVEACGGLGVPCCVYGFQDELIRFVDFGDPVDESAKRNLAALPLEIAGNRPGGHNEPSYNDDGPCLAAAAEHLLGRPEHDRILIIISDGLPEGRRSNASYLRAVIKDLSQPSVDLELMAIGLGPDTEHVKAFYSQSIANVPVHRFAQEIGDLLERILTGVPTTTSVE